MSLLMICPSEVVCEYKLKLQVFLNKAGRLKIRRKEIEWIKCSLH